MTKPPENFELQTNLNYVVKEGDLFFSKAGYSWRKTNSSVGYKIKNVFGGNIVAFATPIKNKSIKVSLPKPQEPKSDIPEPPEGYVLLENSEDYVLATGDKFINFPHACIYDWSSVYDFAGQTPKFLMKRYGYSCFHVVVKGTPKPRFESERPFPWGY